MASSWIKEVQFRELDIPVSIDSIYSVTPAGKVPVADGDSLYLSNLDDMIGSRVLTPTIYFYPKNSAVLGRGPAGKIISDALALVLVPYYPFSGRLRETSNGKLEVHFGPNQGALMVEATSDMSLDDLADLTVPNPSWEPLIYRLPHQQPYQVVDMPLVIAQVTSFSCGGFSLGLRLCHCLCDGLGAMDFVRSWATMARLGPGAPPINPKPNWSRDSLRPRTPPLVECLHPEFERVEDSSSLGAALYRAKLVQKCYRVSREFQLRLKELARKDGDAACTTFESMAAHVWRCWARALEIRPLDFELRLTFSVNVRPMMRDPPLGAGFYGNVLGVACARCTVGRLINDGLSATAQLIHKARAGVTEKYMKSLIDYIEANRPSRVEFGGKLTITQWTRFPMYESCDFGWGPASYVGPYDLKPTPQVCVLLPVSGEAPGGPVAVWICLPENAASLFKEYLTRP